MSLLDILKKHPDWDDGLENAKREIAGDAFTKAQTKKAMLQLASPTTMQDVVVYPTQHPNLIQPTVSHPHFKNRDVAQEFQISGPPEPLSPNHPKGRIVTKGYERGDPEGVEPEADEKVPWWWPKELL